MVTACKGVDETGEGCEGCGCRPAKGQTMQDFSHNGIKFQVGPRTPCPGIGWRIQRADGTWRESGGAFYDGADDHPEGAYAWAEASARKFIDRVLMDRPFGCNRG